MEEKDYTKELLKIAFAAMVADGDIHEDEEAMLRDIEKNDQYFKEYNMSSDLDMLKEQFKEKHLELPHQINNATYHLELDNVQKMKMLEVAIGITHADHKMMPSEIEFIKKLIINLQVPTEIVNERFGNWEIIKQTLD